MIVDVVCEEEGNQCNFITVEIGPEDNPTKPQVESTMVWNLFITMKRQYTRFIPSIDNIGSLLVVRTASMLIRAFSYAVVLTTSVIASEIDVNDIADQWSNTRGRVRNYSVTIVEHRLTPANTFSGPSELFPAKDTQYTRETRILARGTSVRVESKGLLPNTSEARFLEHGVITVDSEGENRSLISSGSRDQAFGRLALGEMTERSMLALWPVFWNLRPGDPSFPTPSSSIKLRADDVKVCDNRLGSVACVLIEENKDGIVHKWWLDPTKAFNVIRYEVSRSANDRIPLQLEIEYKPHVELGWQVTEWTANSFAPTGDLRSSCRSVLASLELNNEMNDDVFELDFSPGTFVVDNRDVGRVDVLRVEDDGTFSTYPRHKLLPSFNKPRRL